jgi:hypothetical protein
MPSFLVAKHAAEVRPHAQGELCCLARHHFKACPTPAPTVSGSLIQKVSLASYPPRSRRRWCGPQILHLSSVAACRHPYPGSPAGAHSRCFPASVGLHLPHRDSARIRPASVYPSYPALPAILAWIRTLRGCSVRLMLRPAALVGATDWVPPQVASLRLACLQQFRATVSGQIPPICCQTNVPSTYSVKRETTELDSFHSRRKEVRISYMGGTTVSRGSILRTNQKTYE